MVILKKTKINIDNFFLNMAIISFINILDDDKYFKSMKPFEVINRAKM